MKTSIVLTDEISYDEDERKTMQNYTLEVDSEDTILSVMLQFEELTGYPPVVQTFAFSKKYFDPDKKYFHHDTPGTLAENGLVPTSRFPVPISVKVDSSGRDKLVKDTLTDLGLSVRGGMFPDVSEMIQLIRNRDKKMLIYVMDYIRRDGGRMKMLVVVEPGDMVGSLMEQVRRRRLYPLAMQRLMVSDPADPYTEKRMDRLDATLAEYNVKNKSVIKLFMCQEFAVKADKEERGKVFPNNKA